VKLEERIADPPTPHTALLAAAEALRIAATAVATDAVRAFDPGERYRSAVLADRLSMDRKVMLYRAQRYQPKEASE
jgi:hypothetical protein